MLADSIFSQAKREAAVRYAWTFLGLPYHWGGDDPIRGFDCSGLVIEVLKSVGLLPPNYDTTANGLYIRYASKVVAQGYAGCLLFWFNSQMIATHIELMVDDYHAIGASGGGSSTTSQQAAIDQNAYVKLRPINYRGQGYKIVDPFKVP